MVAAHRGSLAVGGRRTSVVGLANISENSNSIQKDIRKIQSPFRFKFLFTFRQQLVIVLLCGLFCKLCEISTQMLLVL